MMSQSIITAMLIGDVQSGGIPWTFFASVVPDVLKQSGFWVIAHHAANSSPIKKKAYKKNNIQKNNLDDGIFKRELL